MEREKYWLIFTGADGSRLPRSLPLGELTTVRGGPAATRSAPAIESFIKLIESKGGLEALKPGGKMVLGTMGDFTINLYRTTEEL